MSDHGQRSGPGPVSICGTRHYCASCSGGPRESLSRRSGTRPREGCVMVTGAGGSVGSELVRQVSSAPAEPLILV